ncbi:hypothetical protein [Fibrella forsythiae]|uniref:Trypsin-like peptidase domain-containing protein n=1 Tax=Fibrella forsythiae TaxID=2817061 RepID=A0ABS3JLV7_9BACT|nr:hypothetical protein [Fibrella forsythiae]MBO0950990.1 hypothetical protein [Fibrella forsythiae]
MVISSEKGRISVGTWQQERVRLPLTCLFLFDALMLTNVPTTSPDFPLNNLWQTVTITLFVLSMINERITNFIKLNIESVLTRLLTPTGYAALFNGRTNFKLAEDDPVAEKNRERGIINWAVICGFFVAAFCGADLVHMLQNKGELLSNQEWNGFWTWDHFLGYLLTAFFISLGSKFWHDLLDVILYTSNLKRRMTNEPELFRSGSADEVREFVELTPAQLASVAQEQQGVALRNQPNVVDVVVGRSLVDGLVRDALIVYVQDDNTAGLPTTVPLNLASGRRFPLPVVYVEKYGGRPTSLFNVGSSINASGSTSFGTICCVLTGTDPNTQVKAFFVLTCSHVLTGNFPINEGGELDRLVRVDVGPKAQGVWRYGLLNRAFDIALTQLDDGDINLFASPLSLQPTVRSLNDTDISQQTPLTILTSRESRRARVSRVLNAPLQITYGGSQDVGLAGLIELEGISSTSSFGRLTIAGDSGSLVYDDERIPVGMIVAGNSTHSYAIAIADILDKLRGAFIQDLILFNTSN